MEKKNNFSLDIKKNKKNVRTCFLTYFNHKNHTIKTSEPGCTVEPTAAALHSLALGWGGLRFIGWKSQEMHSSLYCIFQASGSFALNSLPTVVCIYVHCKKTEKKDKKPQLLRVGPHMRCTTSLRKRWTLLCLCVPIQSYKTDLVMVNQSHSFKTLWHIFSTGCHVVLLRGKMYETVPRLSRDISRYIFTNWITNTKSYIHSTVDVTSPIQFGCLFQSQADSPTNLDALTPYIMTSFMINSWLLRSISILHWSQQVLLPSAVTLGLPHVNISQRLRSLDTGQWKKTKTLVLYLTLNPPSLPQIW